MRYRRPGDLQLGQVLGTNQPYTLPHADRNMHTFICGSTGAGKSKFTERLVRQDIVDWPDTHEGLLLIDPHGGIYKGLMSWIAEEGIDYPIIPIDLTRDDWIAGYNLLRKRSASASVVIDNVVEAVAHVWGQSNTNETPLFEHWADATIRVLYEKGYSLAEFIYLADRSDRSLRQMMTAGITDRTAREWNFANGLSAKDFDAQIGSTVRRLSRFVQTEVLHAMLGQTKHSLDLGQAIEEGHIILVSLDRAGARVSAKAANLFGTLLLADLWTAAQERGQPQDPKDVKRFNVYIDEFSRFVTPTMAEQLAEARGYGLAVTMSQQFPEQLVSQGPHGERLFREVMENASTKVVFRLSDTNNLEPLAKQLFLGTFDVDEVKLKLYGTRVVGYRQETRLSHARGELVGGGEATGHAHGNGNAYGRSTVTSESYSESYSVDPSALDPSGQMRAWNESFGQASGDNVTDSHFASESSSTSRSWATSRSTLESLVDVPILGLELSNVQFRTIEEQTFRAMQKLFLQQDRQCAVRLVGRKAPVFLQTYDVTPAIASEELLERHRQRLMRRWSFFLPMTEAMKTIAERKELLMADALLPTLRAEPVTTRRAVSR